ncbi:MAG: hypothetical protein WC718_05805 [Phycisphaerales bacterium]|jgi:hypothetical protein
MKTMTRFCVTGAVLAASAGLASAQCNPSQLLHSPRSTQDLLGTSVALTFDNSNSPILFSGAIGRDQTGASNLGAVYVYNNNGSFFQAQQLLPAFGSGGFEFGTTIAAAFPYVAISAPGGGVGGLVYVYQKVGNSWTTVYSYEPNGTISTASFGYSLGVTATPIPRVIAGSPGYSPAGAGDAGAFFIHQNNGAWAVQVAKTSVDFQGGAGDHLGTAVAIDGSLMAAGAADGDPSGLFDAGYAVVGKLGGNGQWTFTKFLPSQSQFAAHFGQSIAVNNASHIVAVGTPYFDTSAADIGGAKVDVGCVYVFDATNPGAPVQLARLVPENASANMHFGSKVALSGDRLLISAPGTHQVFEFRQDISGNFTQRSVMSSPAGSNDFASSIALANNLAAVGDDLNTVSPTTWQGAVYYSYLTGGMGGDTFEAALPMLPGTSGFACTNAMTPTGFSVGNCGNGGGLGNDAWFTFTPGCGGQVTIDAVGSSFDTVLTIHDAKPQVFSTHNIGCSDDIVNGSNLQSRITINVEAGQQYWARVAGYNAGAQGDATINLSNVFAVNDDCVSAFSVGEGTTLGSTCAATNSIFNALDCSGLSRTFNKDVWFNFVPGATGMYDLTTCGSTFDTLLAVYTSCPGANVFPIACNDDATVCEPLRSKVSAMLNAGQSYKIRLGGFNSSASGEFALNIAMQAGPCDPDVNQDGNVDQGDVDYLINVIAGGPNPSAIDPDFNQDGNADQGDVDAMINTIAGGPCP